VVPVSQYPKANYVTNVKETSMSQTPDYLGVYKAAVIAHTLSKTKNGYPQIVQKYSLQEYYDQKDQEWKDVTDNGWYMTGYFCLVGLNKETGEQSTTLNHTQICNTFDWDGCGLGYVRDDQNFVGRTVQIRVDEDTYEKAKSPVCVGWIDREDADPNPGLRGISDDEFGDMLNQFSDLFGGDQKKKAAKVPTKNIKKSTAKKDAMPDAEEAPAEPVAPKDKKEVLKSRSERIKEANKKVVPPSPPTEKKHDTEEYGKKEAWAEIYDRRDPDAEDDQVIISWKNAILEVSDGAGEGSIDADGWHAVVETVLGELGEVER